MDKILRGQKRMQKQMDEMQAKERAINEIRASHVRLQNFTVTPQTSVDFRYKLAHKFLTGSELADGLDARTAFLMSVQKINNKSPNNRQKVIKSNDSTIEFVNLWYNDHYTRQQEIRALARRS